jgi:hypothetical protein
MRPGLFLLLLLADALWPCTVEIYSIEAMVNRHPNIVVGVVESVEGEIVRGEEGANPIRALTSARFRIEETLKGDLATTAIELTFDPETGRSSCDYMYQPFQPGRRLLLMLGHTQAEGPYRPPLIAPAILGIPGDYVEHPCLAGALPLYRGGRDQRGGARLGGGQAGRVLKVSKGFR